jgi:hypothetical protein
MEPKCKGVVFIEFYEHHMLKVNYKLKLLYADTSDLYFLRNLFIDFNTGYSFYAFILESV